MSLPRASSTASTNFQSVFDAALDSYARQTGVDLTKHPSADKLQNCCSPEEVIQLLSERETAFKDYRDKYRKLIDRLSPVVKVVHAFSGVLGEGAGLVPFQPTSVIFVGIDVLLSAATGVSTSYDALIDLFECVENFVNRLHIYTERISLSPTMSDIVVKIMAQVLAVLALATKQIKQGRLKKFSKKLLGENDVEAILQRLDRLTQEEARMTAAHTLEVVHGLFNNLKEVMDDGKASTADIQHALALIQETTDRTNKIERNLFQKDIRSWLFPPDPSTNHNIACRDHLDGTASWFIQSSTFKEWKTAGSFLWIYGKPGAGKSILCSSIIKEIEGRCYMGLALMAYFYCDFRDPKKQEATGLMSSIIAQLAAKSDSCYNILSALYLHCDAGSRQPGDHVLLDCLERMLNTEGLPTIYIIIDGIDECSQLPGVVPPRERVLQLVEKLVDLHLENLCICATSRSEADIRASLAPLASHTVSLHDQDGQKKDIDDYVRFVVYSDRHMRRWKVEDKEMVVDSLSQRGDGMFRWIVCQLEALRNCFPSAIRHALDDLPEGLDETYDRILLGIARERQECARRLLHCVSVSIRPLRVEELAEILAIKFDAGRLPNYDMNWRPENSEEAVLLACSSLITIITAGGSRVVQFSHYSVKEYLTSERLANAGKHLSRHDILPHSAHTFLAQASLSVLLALDGQVDREDVKKIPLTVYAARYWVDHAQFGDVSSDVRGEMERLFDPSEPHFATWVWIYDIDHPFREILFAPRPTQPEAVPLYYATLCGFRGIVKHLILTCSQDINAMGGHYDTPLHAAVAKGNVDVTMLFLEYGADVTSWNREKDTPMHVASRKSSLDIVELLLKHHVDVDIRNGDGLTPLSQVSSHGQLDATRALLRHGASADSRDVGGWTPLSFASRYGRLDTVHLLLQSGAAVDSCSNDGQNPLMLASRFGHVDIVCLLLQSGAALDPCDNNGWTPLEYASRGGHGNIVRLLLQSGAAADTHDNQGWTPLMEASQEGHLDIIRMLLQSGAAANTHIEDGWSPLMLASHDGDADVVRLLLQSGAAVDSRDKDGWTSLLLASHEGHADIAHLLLQSGAVVDSRAEDGCTPLKAASQEGHVDIVRLLLQSGATVNAPDNGSWNPLMQASQQGHSDVIHLLLQSNAAVDSCNDYGVTALALASMLGHVDIVRLLLQSSAAVDPRDNDGWTPLMLASHKGHADIVRLILQGGAAVDPRDNDSWTPLMLASHKGHADIVRLLLQSGAAVDSRDNDGWTPLMLASYKGQADIVRLLLQSGAAVDSRDNDGWTPLMLASHKGHADIVHLLLQGGAVVDSPSNTGSTPLMAASYKRHLDIIRLLLQSGAAVNTHNEDGWSPLMFASKDGHLDVICLLLQSNATMLHQRSVAWDLHENGSWTPPSDSNPEEQKFGIPLLIASANGHLLVAEFFIQRGADVNEPDEDGETPLSLASGHGWLNIVHLLLKSGSNVNSQDNDVSTPLHKAAEGGHLAIVGLLLGSGADANIRNSNDETPLDVARDNERLDIERLLEEWMGGVDSQDCINLALLDTLSEDRSPNVEQPSVGHGDDTNVADGRTSLHTASAEGNLEIIRSILDGGAYVNDRDSFHQTALLMASWDGKFEVAQLLIRYEADVNSTDGVGWTPLHAASRGGHSDIVHLLLDHGADVNAKKVDHWTALHLASYFNFFDTAKALVERGANVHERNDEGQTPFQLAVTRGRQEIVRLLSEHGMDGVVDY